MYKRLFRRGLTIFCPVHVHHQLYLILELGLALIAKKDEKFNLNKIQYVCKVFPE
jgi:hypothetical protein